MNMEFIGLERNIERFEKALGHSPDKWVINGEFMGYRTSVIQENWSMFLLGLSYSNFEADTGLTKAPNAGFQL